MDVLIACHCERIHKELYIVKKDLIHTPLSITPGITSVTYVDTSCPETRWDTIAHSSKDLIWTMHCPIYLELFETDYGVTGGILRQILSSSWHILKPGGKIIFPIGLSDGTIGLRGTIREKYLNNPIALRDSINTLVGQLDNMPYIANVVSTYVYMYQSGYYIKMADEVVKDFLVILEKPLTAGGVRGFRDSKKGKNGKSGKKSRKSRKSKNSKKVSKCIYF